MRSWKVGEGQGCSAMVGSRTCQAVMTSTITRFDSSCKPGAGWLIRFQERLSEDRVTWKSDGARKLQVWVERSQCHA